ncbi:hypothetical protein EVAR_41454_1 [Eumeta japonica]|uniref:Uncharacterized protein n=1 Tax=Eumeta variegata TaxID=151549 RepID=A0A4C1W4W4_EUMVA|nr:hypothetical protein EVAR_41454_1 [Eumeta japonica]
MGRVVNLALVDSPRHHALNYIIRPALIFIKVPSISRGVRACEPIEGRRSLPSLDFSKPGGVMCFSGLLEGQRGCASRARGWGLAKVRNMAEADKQKDDEDWRVFEVLRSKTPTEVSYFPQKKN